MVISLILSTAVEVLLLVSLACVLRWKNLHREFPAYYVYLWVAVVSAGSYVALRSLALFSLLPLSTAAMTYYYVSAGLFLVESILIFSVVRSLYTEATSRIPGIQRLGNVVFHWVIVISVILAAVAGLTSHTNAAVLIVAVSDQVERCVSILVLCLLVFLAFAAQKLGITYGSRVFGISFGLAMLATERMVVDALIMGFHQSYLLVNLIGEYPQIFAISLWLVYFLKAEPERKLVTVPLDSPLVQWNTVARLLGNPAGQMVISAPSGFMPGFREVPSEQPAVASPGHAPDFGVVSS